MDPETFYRLAIADPDAAVKALAELPVRDQTVLATTVGMVSLWLGFGQDTDPGWRIRRHAVNNLMDALGGVSRREIKAVIKTYTNPALLRTIGSAARIRLLLVYVAAAIFKHADPDPDTFELCIQRMVAATRVAEHVT